MKNRGNLDGRLDEGYGWTEAEARQRLADRYDDSFSPIGEPESNQVRDRQRVWLAVFEGSMRWASNYKEAIEAADEALLVIAEHGIGSLEIYDRVRVRRIDRQPSSVRDLPRAADA